MSETQPTTVAELLQTIDVGWNKLYGFIDTLSEPQLTELTDAAGWTAKDHLMHVASWEDTLNALLEQIPRWERMGIDQALWRSEDIDQINALLQKRYQAMALTDVRQKHHEVHHRLMPQIAALADDDLQRPVRDFQLGSTDPRPLLRALIADTYEAYEEHRTWIAAIVARSS